MRMLTADQQARVEHWFAALCEADDASRATLQSTLAGEEDIVRYEVDALWRMHGRAARFLEESSMSAAVAAVLSAAGNGELRDPMIDQRLGPWRITSLIARGGMGAVYRACRDDRAFQKEVAVKLIAPAPAPAPGRGRESQLHRFSHEVQALARLEHPHIARLIDGGFTDRGEPYLVMELVEGLPLLKDAAARGLDLRGRIEQLVRVAEAVQHAHQRGVIHRDLKPDNILVDAAGNPRVLDFGIARLIEDDGELATFRTTDGQLLGTVPYMSPEQLCGDHAEIDTRSDVYALGVVGYELLSGQLPFDVRGRPLPEAIRIVCEQQPRPLHALNRRLRGDLETIIAKAIERDTRRRYASAAEFAADLRRYLNREPIAARRATTVDLLRNLARRHRAAAAGVVAVCFVMMAGLATTTWQLVRAVRAERLAAERTALADELRGKAEQARDDARREAAEARAINDVLDMIITSPNPGRSGADVRVIDALDAAENWLDGGKVCEPAVQAAVHDSIGRAYESLDLLDRAEPHLVRAVELRRAQLGSDHPTTLTSVSSLADVYRRQDRLDLAEPLLRAAYDAECRRVGPEHPHALMLANGLAMTLARLSRFDEAHQLYDRTSESMRRLMGEANLSTLLVLHNQALAFGAEGRHEDALAQQETILSLLADSPVARTWHADLFRRAHGETLLALGRPIEAEPVLLAAHEALLAALGPDHRQTRIAARDLARLYDSFGESDEAQAWRDRARDDDISPAATDDDVK